MVKRGGVILATLGTIHSLNHSLFLVLPPLLTIIIKDINASIELIALITTTGYLIYGVGSLLGGYLSDKIGEVRVVMLSSFLMGASTLIIFFFKNIVGFGLGFLIMATWASLYHPTANSLISKIFKKDMGFAMATHGAWGTFGTVLAPTVSVLIGVNYGWNYSYLFYGTLTMIASLTILRFENPKAELRRQDISILSILKIKALWLLFIYGIIGGMYYRGLEFILPTYLIKNKNAPIEIAGMIVSLVLATGIFGQFLGGKTADTFGPKKVLIMSSVGVFLGFISIILIPNIIAAVTLFIILYGCFFYSSQPATNLLIASLTDEKSRGRVFGVMFFLFFSVGSLSVVITGMLTQYLEVSAAMFSLAVLASLSLPIVFLLPSKKA
jgi:MFS family permease